MSDMICRKTMRRCETPGMCSPFGGCSDGGRSKLAPIGYDSQHFPTDEWIPVAERVPEVEVDVLTWDGKYIRIDWIGSKRDFGRGVTHWMPLPAAPEAA